MIKKWSFFNRNTQHGGMLVELMMTIALAAIIIPFVFRYQQTAVIRARNVAITKQMENVQTALERYIIENKSELMRPTGKNISRVKIADLVDIINGYWAGITTSGPPYYLKTKNLIYIDQNKDKFDSNTEKNTLLNQNLSKENNDNDNNFKRRKHQFATQKY